MVGERHVYFVEITFNRRKFSRIIIDLHYRERHAESVNDELILKLVKTLDGDEHPVDSVQEGFEFIKVEPVRWQGKSYRLILTLEQRENFLGVVNAFRVED